MSTASTSDDFPVIQTLTTTGLPASPVDTFARHGKVPGHKQSALDSAILVVGGGGIGGWAALGLLKTGAKKLLLIEPDTVDRTNLPRQFFFPEDLFAPKALRLLANIAPHATAAAKLTGIALSFEEAANRFPLPVDVLVCGVDNNACRLACVNFARARQIPAVFTMLSTDGMRCHSFLQGPRREDACLWCVLPNLDPAQAAVCDAGAIISSCFLAAAVSVFFTHRALMGWSKGIAPFNWREHDLMGQVQDRTAMVHRRARCPVCANA